MARSAKVPVSRRRRKPAGPKSPVGGNSLEFVADDLAAYEDAIRKLAAGGRRRICLRPFDARARELARRLSQAGRGIAILAEDVVSGTRLPKGVVRRQKDSAVDATVILHGKPGRVASALMDYLDQRTGSLVAPITDRYFANRPVFMISIPKAGTHLLWELLGALGYRPGEQWRNKLTPGFWYYLEYSNSHTGAPEFFVDTVRRSPFGNRDHPFMRTPALFIYRNPLDILVSEANWYHKEGNSPFAAYLAPHAFAKRLNKLIDDPALLGSIRDRVNRFAAWLEFNNVIPISFEELIGAEGGADADAQLRLIWSLQLKLQVPGRPKDIAKRLFNSESPTFRSGRVGAYKKAMSKQAWTRFNRLPDDFMKTFGYRSDAKDAKALSDRAETFRRRPLKIGRTDFGETPILLEPSFLGYNLIAFRGRIYGVEASRGVVDFTTMSKDELAKLASSHDLQDLKNGLTAGELRVRLEPVFLTAAETVLGPKLARALEGTLAPVLSGQLEAALAPKLARQIEGVLAPALSKSLEGNLAPKLAQQLEGELAPKLAQQLESALAPKLAQRLEGELAPKLAQRLEGELAPKLAQQLEGALAPKLAQRLEGELTPKLAQRLEGELAPKLAQQLEGELAPKLARQLEGELAPKLARQLEGELAPKLAQQLESELAPKLAKQLESLLRPRLAELLEEPLRATLGQQLQGSLEPVLAERLKDVLHDPLSKALQPRLLEALGRSLPARLMPELTATLRAALAPEIGPLIQPSIEAQVEQRIVRNVVGLPKLWGSFLGYNIVRVQHRFFAVPQEAGNFDLTAMGRIPEELGVLAGHSLSYLKLRVFACRALTVLRLRKRTPVSETSQIL